MPDFVVAGEPGVVAARAGVMRTRAGVFTQVSDSLAAVSTGGWTGRAADRFSDRFEVEPVRWAQAAEGFVTAAAALEQYAQTLSWAQEQGQWAAGEWERGEQVTVSARAEYEADVAAGRAEKAAWEVDNGPGTFTLTIHPFTDPGEPIRAGAVSTHQDTLAQLETAAHTCAAVVRAGCAHAPDKRNWAQSGLAFVGGVFAGAGEAVWDLAQLGFRFSPAGMVYEMTRLATGEITPEEMAAKWQLHAETAQGLLTAVREDPIGFGKNMGKSLLDWDTWADDPARALGHLVPDAIAAAFTAGTGTAATRGASATSMLARHADDLADGVSDTARLANRLDDTPDVTDLTRTFDDAADLGGRGDDASRALAAFDDVPTPPQGTHRSLDDPQIESWLDDVGEVRPDMPREDARALYDYTTDAGYRDMNGRLRSPDTHSSAADSRIQGVRNALDRLPSHQGTSYRGTNLPNSVMDDVLSNRRLSDPAFTSSSLNRSIVDDFFDATGSNPARITIEGHSGSNIRPFSALQDEAEVLFRDGIDFEVMDVVRGADGVWEIVVREP